MIEIQGRRISFEVYKDMNVQQQVVQPQSQHQQQQQQQGTGDENKEEESDDRNSLAYMFTRLEEIKTKLNLESYSLNQTTLEQIFIRMAKLCYKQTIYIYIYITIYIYIYICIY